MIKTVIAIYPGRFQPMGKHHKDAFKWLENKFGAANTYIATSDKVDPPKSPLNFNEKKSIAKLHGVAKNLVQVKNPYKAEEITSKYDPKTTAVVFMVGQKDMQEDPRFRIGKKKDGGDSYFQKYEPGKAMKPYPEHGYLIVAPHVSYNIEGIGEMSGTNIRKALSNPNVTPEQFKDIFGWYDKKIQDMLYSKFTGNEKKEKTISEVIEEQAVLRTLLRTLITEGGAAGHMAHPFDIPSVKTGKDLVKVFDETASFLAKNPAPVKIDGINASIRLANVGKKKQFVLDRGSNKPLDVKGITKNDLEDRFGPGHGMIVTGAKVLDIFNKALPNIQPELKKLGMLEDPNRMLNIEYVEGKSNVQEYESNFLAIHNMLEIKQVSPTKRATNEVSYDKKAMKDLIQKVGLVAKKSGFEVMGEIPAKLDRKPNFGSELSKSQTVNIDGKQKETKSLQKWLDQAKNTKGVKLKLKDGKTVDALSKQVFVYVKEGKPINELVADTKDAKIAVDSYVIYMATMVLGDKILEVMSSPLGSVKDQEGIVVRDPKVYDKPYKITGSFILRGLQTAFGK